MMEAGWDGWGMDWDGRVDVAPPRCQASLHRAESSLRTPGGSERGDYSSGYWGAEAVDGKRGRRGGGGGG